MKRAWSALFGWGSIGEEHGMKCFFTEKGERVGLNIFGNHFTKPFRTVFEKEISFPNFAKSDVISQKEENKLVFDLDEGYGKIYLIEDDYFVVEFLDNGRKIAAFNYNGEMIDSSYFQWRESFIERIYNENKNGKTKKCFNRTLLLKTTDVLDLEFKD